MGTDGGDGLGDLLEGQAAGHGKRVRLAQRRVEDIEIEVQVAQRSVAQRSVDGRLGGKPGESSRDVRISAGGCAVSSSITL